MDKCSKPKVVARHHLGGVLWRHRERNGSLPAYPGRKNHRLAIMSVSYCFTCKQYFPEVVLHFFCYNYCNCTILSCFCDVSKCSVWKAVTTTCTADTRCVPIPQWHEAGLMGSLYLIPKVFPINIPALCFCEIGFMMHIVVQFVWVKTNNGTSINFP